MVIFNNIRGQSFLDIISGMLPHAHRVDIVVGYVSPGGCELLHLRELARTVAVRIVVGRACEEGLARTTKAYLAVLHEIASRTGGGVRLATPSSHAKMYCLTLGSDAHNGHVCAFIGSSNLTENGLRDWHECDVFATGSDAVVARTEAERLFETGLPLSAARENDPQPIRRRRSPDDYEAVAIPREPGSPGTDKELRLSFLTRSGDLGEKSGLNWWNGGGRERHPDEAYVPLRSNEVQSGLVHDVFGSALPGTRFWAVMHDGTEMEMMLQGEQPVRLPNGQTITSAKQITSAGNTHEFGTWILRHVLRIPVGQLVTAEDLRRYGRTDISFRRIGTATDGRAIVFVDFSHVTLNNWRGVDDFSSMEPAAR